MKAYIDKAALVAEIDDWRDKIEKGIFSIPLTGSDKAYATFEYEILGKVRDFLDTLEAEEVQEEPVSNDLEDAAHQYAWDRQEHHIDFDGDEYLDYGVRFDSFKAGAEWQKEQMIDKACNYLFSHMGLFVTFFDDDIVEDIERSEFIKKFRKAMEE